MKYFKISNKGELDIRLISLMGGTTKAENPNKIGQFGTGLKYAIAYLIRNKNNFRLFIGTDEVEFETREEEISGKMFSEIYCNGKSMNITTHYGYQWKCWEAIREIWCNAKDEGGEQKKETSENSIISGVSGRTTFYIELTEEMQGMIATWDEYFLSQKPIFDNANYSVYLNEGETLKLYKNKVLVHISKEPSMFVYDLKQTDLNELRQYMGYARSDIGRTLLSSNKEVIELYLAGFEKSNQRVEFNIDYQFLYYDPKHVQEIFQGYLFLHPESQRSSSKKSIQVNKSLFYVLQACNLPSEKIYSRSGSYYGGYGSGYFENKEVLYEEVKNDTLESKIQSILDKYKSKIHFQIAVPVDSDFEIMFSEYEEPIFSADLYHKSDSDLEAIVLVSIFHTKEGNIFKALTRLIKFALSNKSFERIFFGSK